MTDSRHELIDELAYCMILAYREVPQINSGPEDLLFCLKAMDPSVPDQVWLEAGARACRKRSEELLKKAEDLWLYSQLRSVQEDP